MFSNQRQGSQLYILHKCAATPFVEMGSVENTTNLMTGYYPSLPNMPVNLSIRVGEKVTNYQNLPPNAEVADVTNNTGETVTLACTKEAVTAEIQAMKQKSIDTINSVDFHKQRINTCEMLIQQLNPEEVEKAKQQQEISDLKAQIAQMSQMMAKMSEQLKGEETSS